jgi:hypothetical protein
LATHDYSRIREHHTKTGVVIEVTIPKRVVTDKGFTLSPGEEVVVRVVKRGLLIEKSRKGG